MTTGKMRSRSVEFVYGEDELVSLGFLIEGGSMKTFSYRTSFKVYRIVRCGCPLGVLCATLIYTAVSADAPGVVLAFLARGWMPVILPGSLIWLALESVRAIGAFRYSVGLSDDTIRVNDATVRWSDIIDAEFTGAMWSGPAIFLHRLHAPSLRIPAAVEGLEDISIVVKDQILRKVPAGQSRREPPEPPAANDWCVAKNLCNGGARGV
jgi:hypothetical protein